MFILYKMKVHFANLIIRSPTLPTSKAFKKFSDSMLGLNIVGIATEQAKPGDNFAIKLLERVFLW